MAKDKGKKKKKQESSSDYSSSSVSDSDEDEIVEEKKGKDAKNKKKQSNSDSEMMDWRFVKRGKKKNKKEIHFEINNKNIADTECEGIVNSIDKQFNVQGGACRAIIKKYFTEDEEKDNGDDSDEVIDKNNKQTNVKEKVDPSQLYVDLLKKQIGGDDDKNRELEDGSIIPIQTKSKNKKIAKNKNHSDSDNESDDNDNHRNNIKTIFNIVYPPFHGDEQETLLENLVKNICIQANESELKSIAFYPIGTGILNTPVEVCASAMGKGFREFIDYYNEYIEKIEICIYEGDESESGSLKYEFENTWRDPNKEETEAPDCSEDETEEQIRKDFAKQKIKRRNTSSEEEEKW